MASLQHSVRPAPASLAGGPHLRLWALSRRVHPASPASQVRPFSCIRGAQGFLTTPCSKTPAKAQTAVASLEVNSVGPPQPPAPPRTSAGPLQGRPSPVPAHLSFLRSPRAAGLTAILGNVAAEVCDWLQEDRPSTLRGDCGGVLHSECDSEPAGSRDGRVRAGRPRHTAVSTGA